MMVDQRRLSAPEAETWRTQVQELIKHESNLVNQRVTWLVQVQGLLFAALGFLWGKAPTTLVLLFCFLGIATAFSIWNVLALYSPAIQQLVNWWRENKPQDAINGPIIGFDKKSKGLERFLRPWRALPLIFILAWSGVAVITVLELRVI
jgi:hypothetical protein